MIISIDEDFTQVISVRDANDLLTILIYKYLFKFLLLLNHKMIPTTKATTTRTAVTGTTTSITGSKSSVDHNG